MLNQHLIVKNANTKGGKMPKYKVTRYTVYTDVVEAKDEQTAIEKADNDAKWTFALTDDIVEELNENGEPIDPKHLVVEETIECYKCGEKQESTQRFCVECGTCLT